MPNSVPEHRSSQPYGRIKEQLADPFLLGSQRFLLFDIHTRLAFCAADALISLTTSKGVLWEALGIPGHKCMHCTVLHSPCVTNVWLSLELQGHGCIIDSSTDKREIAVVYKRIIQESKNSQRYQAITRET